MTDLLGRRLGNYRLTRLIGGGGFAEVYQGEHVHLGTKAALKVLQTQLAPQEQEHFLQEARIIARLVHPHIVRVLDFGLEGAIPFLVMDYAPHGLVRQYYPKGAPLSAQKVLPLLQQVASALQYAHDQQVIHRDVKPENMLLDSQDKVMLSDFGIAVIVQSTRADSTRDVLGTAAYMAPEQIKGHPRPASDQYALGVVLYEWLSGDCPFSGSFSEVCSQHLFVPPPPLREKLPTISPAVEAVITQALAKDPDQRFASVQALADAFAVACQDDTLSSAEDATRRRFPSTASAPSTTHMAIPTPSLPPTERAEPHKGAIPELPSLPSSASANQQVISRRALFITAGGVLVGLAGVGGLAWAILSQARHHVSSAQFTTPPPPTPSSTPAPTQGSTIFTYRQHTGTVYCVSWSPNGQYIVSGSADTTERVWQASHGEALYVYRGHAGLLNTVFSVSWATNGQWIASGSADKTAQVWEAATGNPMTLYRGHSARVLSVACAPHAALVASGSADKTVQVWEATTGKIRGFYQGHTDTVYAVAWSPDGKLIASAGADKTVQVWEVATMTMIAQYAGHTGAVYAVAWSPDGRWLVSGGADRTVRIWEAHTAKEQRVMMGSTGLATAISSVTWSPDGKGIASAGTDTRVRVWDATTGKLVYTYRQHTGPVYTVAWTPDGSSLASGSADRTVKIWRAL